MNDGYNDNHVIILLKSNNNNYQLQNGMKT